MSASPVWFIILYLITAINGINISSVRVNNLKERSAIFSYEKISVSWSLTFAHWDSDINFIQESFRVEISAKFNSEMLPVYDTGALKHQNSNSLEISLRELHLEKVLGSVVPINVKVSIWGENFQTEQSSEFFVLKNSPENFLQDAQWIQENSAKVDVSSSLLRKNFEISNKIISHAVLTFSGLGLSEVELNGKIISDGIFEPQWTKYDKTVVYSVVPVDTGIFNSGTNTILVYLGNGMYNVPANSGRYQKFAGSFGSRKLIFSLYVQFSDSSSVNITSDVTWEYLVRPPIVFNTIYGGETFDERNSRNSWNPVVICNPPLGKLSPRKSSPVKVLERFVNSTISVPKNGIYVFDFGRNFAGRPVIQITIPSGISLGTEIKFVPGELLDSNGLVTQASSGSPMYFSYITGNNVGTITWNPRFSYYGYRWIQVEGAVPRNFSKNGDIIIEQLIGERIGNSLGISGGFNSDNTLYNDIHRMILFAMQSNIQSILTDCPHRERLGWLEQDHLMGTSVLYNFDLLDIHRKIVSDMIDSQLGNGLIPDISPEFTIFDSGYRDSPEWGSSLILVSVLNYVHYSDSSLLELIFQNGTSPGISYVNYLLGKLAKNGILDYGLGDWNDIGQTLNGNQLTPLGLTATLTLYMDLIAAANSMEVIGGDSAEYLELANKIRNSFNNIFLQQNSNKSFFFGSNSQTSNAMPLVFSDLIPNSTVYQNSLNFLISDFTTKFQNRTSCGEVGFPFEICTFTQNGRNDLIESMLNNGNGWGYKYMLDNGATTLTEAWNAAPTESQNHYMLGHIDMWFYGVIAGINIGNWEILEFTTNNKIPVSFCEWWNFKPKKNEISVFINPKIFDIQSVSRASAWHWTQSTGNITVEWNRNSNPVGYSLAVSIQPPAHLKTMLCLPFLEFPGEPVYASRQYGRYFVGTNSLEKCNLYLLSSGIHHFKS